MKVEIKVFEEKDWEQTPVFTTLDFSGDEEANDFCSFLAMWIGKKIRWNRIESCQGHYCDPREDQPCLAWELFTGIESVLKEAIKSGADQKTVFESTRDFLVKVFGYTQLQAANLVRLILHNISKTVGGKGLYSDEQLNVISELVRA